MYVMYASDRLVVRFYMVVWSGVGLVHPWVMASISGLRPRRDETGGSISPLAPSLAPFSHLSPIHLFFVSSLFTSPLFPSIILTSSYLVFATQLIDSIIDLLLSPYHLDGNEAES